MILKADEFATRKAATPLADGAFLNRVLPPPALDPRRGDAHFCGAVVRGSCLSFATVTRIQGSIRVWHPGCRTIELTGLRQDDVSRFSAAVMSFVADSMTGSCGLKGPSNIDDMLTWMLFQKIETVLQLQPNVDVDLISPNELSDWIASSGLLHPAILGQKHLGPRGLFNETLTVAAFIAAGGRVDD